ncbi:hypothetical protein NUSPORA_01837 [Nucleospora cyclopteri]
MRVLMLFDRRYNFNKSQKGALERLEIGKTMQTNAIFHCLKTNRDYIEKTLFLNKIMFDRYK